jgi:arylsulfatase A-like enzyme
LITLDTTRFDALGTNGSGVRSTPVLDELALESLSFDACRTVAPLTLPSHASMMTGLYPPRHGIRDNGYAALSDDAVTLAERVREAGLRTAAFISAVVLDRRFGLDQGFETYAQPERPEEEVSHVYAERPARDVVREAIQWLNGLDPEEPFFAWVHLFDPHAPYRPAPEFAAQAGGDLYLGEVAATDHAVGELIAALTTQGRLDSTIIVVTADHGEDRMDHGEPTHASYCYDSTVKVPLLVRYPDGRRAGERTSAVVSVVDVYPTLLGALGLDDPGGHDGLDLGAGELPERRGVYFETYYNFINYGWSPLAGWADSEGKYIHSPSPELYRTDDDPDERRNLAPELTPTVAERYRAAIAAVMLAPGLSDKVHAEPDAELTHQLQSLGYAAGRAPDELPSPLEHGDLPAPADRLPELHEFIEASELSDQGRCAEALALFASVVEGNPANRIALDRYAFCLIQSKQWAQAIEVLQQRIACGRESAATHINLGVCYQNARRAEDAVRHYHRALELDPAHRTGRGNLVRLLESLGRSDEAARVRAGG